MLSKIIKVAAASLFLAGFNVGYYLVIVPLLIASCGFYLGLAMAAFIWLVTLALSFAYIEVIIPLPEGSNFPTLIEKNFGKLAKIITTVLILIFFFYLTLVYYIQFFMPFLQEWLHVSNFSMELALIIIFTLLLFSGLITTLIANFFFMAALFISLLLLFQDSLPHLEYDRYHAIDWTYSPLNLYFLFSVTGFQALIPTLSSFLNKDKKSLVATLWIGIFLTLIIIVLLLWIYIGSFPPEQFLAIIEDQDQISQGFNLLKSLPWLNTHVHFLILFNIVSYLLAFSYSILDIIFDSLKVDVKKRRGFKRFLISLAIITLPVLYFIWSPSQLSLISLVPDLINIIVAIIPLLLLWRMRYTTQLIEKPFLPGGKPMIATLLIVLFFLAGLQCMRLIS